MNMILKYVRFLEVCRMLTVLLCIYKCYDVCNIMLQDGCYVVTLCLQIQDPNQVYDAIILGRRIDVVWPGLFIDTILQNT
jgi:hypothetical protein